MIAKSIIYLLETLFHKGFILFELASHVQQIFDTLIRVLDLFDNIIIQRVFDCCHALIQQFRELFVR